MLPFAVIAATVVTLGGHHHLSAIALVPLVVALVAVAVVIVVVIIAALAFAIALIDCCVPSCSFCCCVPLHWQQPCLLLLLDMFDSDCNCEDEG